MTIPITCREAITLSSKGWYDGLYSAITYKLRTLLITYLMWNFYMWYFLPSNHATPSSYVGSLAYPIPLESLAKHQSQVWVDSDTTCHEVITFSPKSRSDGVCSATTYKLITLLITCPVWDSYLWHVVFNNEIYNSIWAIIWAKKKKELDGCLGKDLI